MTSLGICIVGCGAIAEIHVGIFRELGASIECVVGRTAASAASFAERLGIPVATGALDRALETVAIDAVVIASPNHCHAEQATTALEAGRDVLVEIPMALSYDEAVALTELAERRGRVLMPAHSERFIPNIRAVKNRIDRGEVELVHIIARETALRRHNVGWTGRERSWTDDLLWHFGGHAVDLAMWLACANEAEIHVQSSQIDRDTGAVMDIDLMLKTPRQQLISIGLSFNSHFALHEYLMIGREASFHFDRGRMTDVNGRCDDPASLGEDYYHLSWRTQDAEFLAALREQRAPSLSARDVLPAMRMLQDASNLLSVTEVASR